MIRTPLPEAVRLVIERLSREGFRAYVVGGAVRDLILKRPPRDWDVATDARPGQVENLFPRTLATGRKFGTITVWMIGIPVQVTTFRGERSYSDRRHPEEVFFHGDLTRDLARRDFTINAMAFDTKGGGFIDPFGGKRDLRRRLLRTVGGAVFRLEEDALRILRAGRFISELGVRADSDLSSAARELSEHLTVLSSERIRDELSKLLLGAFPSRGLIWLARVGALGAILPDLVRLHGVRQGGRHRYDVFGHTMRSLDAAPFDLTLRMALLLHDVAKPLTRTRDRFGYHFFHHDRIGAEMARSILKRLRYPRPFMNEVSLLVERHLFEVAPLLSSDAALRRFLRRVGEGEAERLIELRKADVRGMGPGRTPSADLRRLLSRIRLERKRRPALEIKDLTIGGEEILKWLQIAPGPPVGRILRRLLEKVLENPALNQRERLKQMVLRDLRDNALH